MRTKIKQLTHLFIAIVFTAMNIVLLIPSRTQAAVGDQINMFDYSNLVHSPAGTGDPYANVIGQVLTSTPNDNWVAPHNYINGNAYVRVNIKEKPSNKLMFMQVCFWRDGATPNQFETCSRGTTFTTTGVYYFNATSPSTWFKKGGVYDWTVPPDNARVMIKEDNAAGELMLTRWCGAHCYTGGDINSHVPIKLDAGMIMVKQGATLDLAQAPTNWSTCPSTVCGPGTPPDPVTACPVADTGFGTVRYDNRLQVSTAATYRAWLLMNVPSTTSNTVEMDTIKVGANTSRCNITVTGSSPGTWQWVSAPGTFAMPVGNHPVALTGKSAGVKVDKIMFLTDLSCTPTGEDGDNCTGGGGGDPGWSDDSRDFRTIVSVDPSGIARTDIPVDKEINFTTVFNQAGASGSTFNPDSLEVVEINTAGEVIDNTVTHQFDKALTGYNATTNAKGNLIFIAEGNTAAATTRRFAVYFDKASKPFTPPVFTNQVTFTDNIADEGQQSFRIQTQAGTWFYHKQGGGFSSLVDAAGKDWLTYSTATGAAGEFRGIPNAVYPGGHFHPGKTTSTSTKLRDGPLKITFNSVTADGWESKWEIYPKVARMTMVDKDTANYWFLYEGTPGGAISTNDFSLRSNGSGAPLQSPIGTAWSGDITGDEWVAFGDPDETRSLFIANHQDDTKVDSYRLMGTGADVDKMTVFGFGRDNITPGLSSVPQKFTVGLLNTATPSTIKNSTLGAYKDLAITTSPGEKRDIDTVSVVITSPVAGATLTGTVTLTATVSSSGDPVDSVEFYDGTTLLGAAIADGTSYTYNWDTQSVADGAHSITAKAYQGGNPPVTSTAVNVTIDNGVPPKTADFNTDGVVCAADYFLFTTYFNAANPNLSDPRILSLAPPTTTYTGADLFAFITQWGTDYAAGLC